MWYSISCSRRVGQVVKTPPSHGGFKGSNPLRVTTHIIARSKASGFFVAFERRVFLFSMANPSHINFTQNLFILFSKHIYGEYPLHLYTDFRLMHSFVEKVVDNLLFIHTESHFIHKVIHIRKKLWINIPPGLDKCPIIYSVRHTVYIVLYFRFFVA